MPNNRSSSMDCDSYDALGRRASVTRGNGTVTRYSYDAASRLVSLAHNLAGTAADVTTTFTYTPSSQLAGLTCSNDAYVWTGLVNVDRAYGVNGLTQLSAGPVENRIGSLGDSACTR